MKILVLPGWYPNASSPYAGDFIMYQVQNLKKAHIEVAVIFADLSILNWRTPFSFTNKVNQTIETGVPTFRKTGFFPPKKTTSLMRTWARQHESLYEAYKQLHGAPDLIHAHVFQGAFAANHLSKKYQIPYIITEHSSSILNKKQTKWKGKLMNDVYDSAEVVIAVGSALKNTLEQHYTKNKVVVIPNSVNTQLFTPGAVNKKRPFTLISVGSLIPAKGFDLLIKAFANCLKNWPGLNLIIVGEGQEKGRLNRLAEHLGVAKAIRFPGQCTQQEVALLLKQAHVLVHPSHFETFGIVLIEALATGIPVIATACGGPEDILTKPYLGYLVPPYNPKKLEEAICRILRNYQNFSKSEIRQFALDNYSNELITERIIQIYREVL